MPTEYQVSQFGPSDFNDKRLDKRFVKIYEAFKKNSKALLSHVFNNSHQCKAAYRFFRNPQVTAGKILNFHHHNLLEILESQSEVLEIQDTTECDFSDHPKTTGLGRLGSEKSPRKGLECHTSLITTTEGLVLGIGSINLWARTELKRNGKKNIRKIPLKDKESMKWLKAIEDFDTSTLKTLSRIIVADREADFYELEDFIHTNNKKMVIRLRFDRKTEEGVMIKDAVKNTEIMGYTKVHIKSKGGIKDCREELEVELAVRYSTFRICAPKNIDRTVITNNTLEVTVIHATEVNPEKEEDALEWYIITNMEVKNLENAIKILGWYSLRWLVEEFHKILKAGIKIEEARLSERKNLEKLIIFLAVIAVRILWLTRINRIDKQGPTALALDNEEEIILQKHSEKHTHKRLNTVNDVVRYIANLGGFKGRKCDGDPGLLTLWRGLIKFYDIMDGYLLGT